MLYLEDYLEMIEHLPQELRDRFTEMREMDLSVQNNMDSLDKRVRTLFQQCRRGELQGPSADSEFYGIRKDYYRVLEDSDEKVQLAGQMYDLVDRYLRRLDSELWKFKCELEADHTGITEILEKRSLELDQSSTSNGGLNQKENRYFDTLMGGLAGAGGGGGVVQSGAARVESRYKIKPEKRRDGPSSMGSSGGPPPEKRQAVAVTSAGMVGNAVVRPTTPNVVSAGPPYHMLTGTTSSASVAVGAAGTSSASNSGPGAVTYNIQQFNAGNAIAAAASQAIAQTQQMQQGRRTASLKASYEAIHGAGAGVAGPHDLLINRELAGATHNALVAVERETCNAFSNQQRRQHKKKITANPSATATLLQQAHVQQKQHQQQQQQQQRQQPQPHPNLSTSSSSSSSALDLLEPTTMPGVLAGGVGIGVGVGVGVASPSVTAVAAAAVAGTSVGPGPTPGGAAGPGGHHHQRSQPHGPTGGVVLNEAGMVVEQTPEGEWTYDPNEPRYCICNQVSYGDMVACDNEDCPFEWFHYPCVNITSSPKGKWYCPQCSSSMKRRASRKN